MRMRRKKHREERLDACADFLIDNIEDFKNDPSVFFETKKQMRLEIGCGKGRFITETAKLNPDVNFIAVEKNADVLVLAVEKAKNEKLTNVKFVRGDAEMMRDALPNTKFDVIYINFCDPWHKSGHAKRRLTHKNYLDIWKNLISENGGIYFKTDNKALFEFSLNSFSDYGMRLKNITLDLHNSNFEGNVMTEYEELFSSKGNPIYRCEAYYRI